MSSPRTNRTSNGKTTFRHAKGGELSERVDELHLVDGDRIVATVPTYRGEGHAFL